MKNVITILLALFSTFLTVAQVDRNERGLSLSLDKIKVGPKVGINNASGLGKVTTSSSQIRQQVGVFAKIGLSKMVQVQPELLFSQKYIKVGSREVVEEILGGREINVEVASKEAELNYITLPIAGKYNFFSKKKLKIFGLFGGYLGYLISENKKEKIGRFINSPNLNFNTIDLGVQAGFALTYSIGPGQAVFDVRGSSSALNAGKYKFNNDKKPIRNLVLPTITAGYAFTL